MRIKNWFLALLVLQGFGLLSLTVQAAPKPPIEPVKPGHSQACVDYFTLNQKMYCSEKPLAPIPELASAQKHEPLNLHFDNRKWRLGWWNEKAGQPMLEYVLNAETVHTWTELVTSQYFPGLQTHMTPKALMGFMLGELRKQGYQPQVNVIEESANNVLYEWALTGTGHDDQAELQRIFQDKTGLYVLHYASRPQINAERRKVWIQLLSKATAK